MLKKWPILVMTLAMAGVANAAITPATPDKDGNCYMISDAAELYGFAAIVNGTLAEGRDAEPTACGKLDANITVNENVLGANNANVDADGSYDNAQAASSFTPWTPIGNSTKKFQGSFNGKGHTISGLYFNNSTTSNVGLFGYTSGAVTIDSVGLVDSYFRGADNVGSIVGQAALVGTKKLTVIRSYNKGVVTGTGNVGGLVGKNGNVQFSYNTGSVTGTSNVGGLVGSNTNVFKINGSYNIGLVKKGAGAGNAVLGYGCPNGGQTGAVQNVYYLEGAGDECSGAYSMTSYEFADGFVAITLHGDNSITGDGADIWGQVVGADKTPLLTGEIVFPITLDNSDNCYEISNADNLYIFAAIVNSGFKSDACGKLTKDIVVNENVLANVNADGSLKDGVNFKEWTPIGFGTNFYKRDNLFSGEFHGQGHTISGLYFNDTEKTENVGLFGYVNGTVVIDGVGLVDSYLNASGSVGGLVGYAVGSLTISDSYNASSVNTPGSGFGGLVGGAGGIYDGDKLIERGLLTISNSYNEGSLNGNKWGGGLVGYADALAVSNSYNAGPVYISGEDISDEEAYAYVGGITSSVDNASTVTNSYNYGAISYPTGNSVSKDDLVAGGGWGEVTVTNSYFIGESEFKDKGATQKSSTQFSDGTVFAQLHSAKDGEVWRQYKNDAYPTFAAKTGTDAPAPMHVATLHYSDTDSTFIAYVEGVGVELPTKDKSGNPIAGWTTSADGTGDVITKIPTSATTDLKLYPKAETFEPNAEGYYEIATADDLYKFAEIVNNGTAVGSGTELGVKAKLVADICVNACGEGESVLNADGTLNGDGSSFTPWTPIGIAGNPFIGTFDGQGYTISGLYFNDLEGVNVGLFGYVGSAEETVSETVSISNVGVEDSYFNANSAVGGVVGWVNYVALNIKNVYNAAVVEGSSYVGGVVGFVILDENQTSIMVNVYNVGSISGTEETEGKTGGLVGYFTKNSKESAFTIKNSYNYGNVVGGYPLVGLVERFCEDCDGNDSVTNSYYLGSSSSGDYGTVKSSIEFADGTVFAALRGADESGSWYQYQDDAYPVIFPKEGATGEMHVATLRYSDTDSTFIAYVEGVGVELPTKDKEGKALSGWTTSEDGTGDVLTEIPTTATTDLKLYPKLFAPNAEGFYEIATVEQLYEFAQIVNGGNSTAKAKLMNDIVVNENVLNANGSLNSSGSFEPWTPIGTSDKPFAGVFDGQGYSISGLYVNDDANDNVGLFGAVSANDAPASTIKNVGVVDSYFSGDENVGAIVGLVKGDITIQYVYSESAVAGSDNVGGLVGDVGASVSFTASEIYNAGSVTAPNGKDHGGILGAAESEAHAQITDGFNYGTVSNGGGDIVGATDGSASVGILDSYYLAASSGGYAYSAADFANGTVLAELRKFPGGYVWVQNPGDKYPTIDINASADAVTIVLDWTSAADSVKLSDWIAKYGEGVDVDIVVKSGKQFYANGKIYEGTLADDQVKAIGDNKLYPISGVELKTVDDVTTATLDGSDGARQSVMIPTDVEVDRVIYKRNITANTYMTIMLPFDVTVVGGYSFYRFCDVAVDKGGYRYVVQVAPVTTFKANTPYIMVATKNNAEGITFEQTSDKYTLNTTTNTPDVTKNEWTMHGVYGYKKWEEGDSELGTVFGFSTTEVQDYVGQFVEAGAGADIVPMRMYLSGTWEEPQGALGRTGRYNYASVVGPSKVIGVEIVDGEEETTTVKHFATVPTVVRANRWFDTKGRALNGKPTAKGTYYYNGQRVIIK